MLYIHISTGCQPETHEEFTPWSPFWGHIHHPCNCCLGKQPQLIVLGGCTGLSGADMETMYWFLMYSCLNSYLKTLKHPIVCFCEG